jgi:hypothetical protein
VIPKVGCTAPWGLPKGALVADPSKRVVRSFTSEVTLDQTLGNWIHFKPIHRITNLLTAKFLNVVSYSYFIFIIFFSGLCKPLF